MFKLHFILNNFHTITCSWSGFFSIPRHLVSKNIQGVPNYCYFISKNFQANKEYYKSFEISDTLYLADGIGIFASNTRDTLYTHRINYVNIYIIISSFAGW